MRYFNLFFLLCILSTTSCIKSESAPVRIENDLVRQELETELRQFESDRGIVENQILMARGRLSQLTMSPKVVDIAKKDLYQKEAFFSQINQRISYLKIKINNREFHFRSHQPVLKNADLIAEHEQYLIDRAANPVKYPWRVASEKKTSVESAPPKSGH